MKVDKGDIVFSCFCFSFCVFLPSSIQRVENESLQRLLRYIADEEDDDAEGEVEGEDEEEDA